MDYRIVVERRVLKEAEEILSHIAEDSPAAALGWYEGLRRRLAGLSRMPKRWPEPPEIELRALGVRQLLYGSYRIFFTVDEADGTVRVHHLRHGARRPATGEETGRVDER